MKRVCAAFLAVFFALKLCGLSMAQAPDEPGAREASKAEAAAEGGDYADEGPTLAEKLNKKVSLNYKDVDIANILRSLSVTHKLNTVTSPDVEGKVTINLTDVPLIKALEAILTLNGLTYSIRDDIIYISVGDTKLVELVSEVIFLKYINAADALNMLRKVLSTSGDMKIDEVANSVIVTDYPTNIKKVKALLDKIDIPPRQVLIEAKIVDITSRDLKALGVTWDYDYQPSHGIFGRSTEYDERYKNTINMAEQSSSLAGGQIILDTLTLKNYTITATIDALAKDGKANLLAAPSIAVLNGQEARIIIGERYPYKERTQTTTGTTETTKFVDIGTTLRVTPQINDDGYITMRIHPEVSSLAQALDAGPRVTTREADTTVRIKEGETIVIGGLIKQKEDAAREKIPLLGDIPLIGFLFTRNDKDIEQTELAVFITPIILYSREEKVKMEKEELYKQEAYVNLSKTAELTVVDSLFSKARKLDTGKGIESWRKDENYRMAQAVSLYEHLYLEYPESIRAPASLYYAAFIYYDHFKNYPRAKRLLSHLIDEYPSSQFIEKGDWLLKKVKEAERAKAKMMRRKAIRSRQERGIGL